VDASGLTLLSEGLRKCQGAICDLSNTRNSARIA